MTPLRWLAERFQVSQTPPFHTPSRGNESDSQPSQGSGSLRLRDLSVDLKAFHLREIDLDIAVGEYVVVLGPTGAGKTVLLETIAGLLHPLQGCVSMDGQNITDIPPERRGIGFVYQDYALFPHLNVADNIAFGLKLRKDLGGLRRLLAPRVITAERRVEEISRLLSIDHLLHRRPKTLSGGEQQRVALARALVIEPQLLLLDEPLSALDPETRMSLQRELARVHRELGTTTLHVTHDFEEAVALGDRIAVVHQGRIVQVGTPEDIFRRPANEFVARFVGVRNVLAGTVVGAADLTGSTTLRKPVRSSEDDDYKTFKSGDLAIAVTTHLTGAAHASIRPEDIIISRVPLPSGAQNRFQGRITDIADRGTLIYVTVNVPPDITCAITRRSLEEMALQEHKEVHIAFKASAMHVF